MEEPIDLVQLRSLVAVSCSVVGYSVHVCSNYRKSMWATLAPPTYLFYVRPNRFVVRNVFPSVFGGSIVTIKTGIVTIDPPKTLGNTSRTTKQSSPT